MLVLTKVTDSQLARIATSELWHYSKATASQLTVRKISGNASNADIRLIAAPSLQLHFWKFIRDFSVVEWPPFKMKDPDWDKFSYLFLGKPSELKRASNVQGAPLAVRILGQDLVERVDRARIFYRPIDGVVGIRGTYEGPALLDPAP